MYWKDAEEKVDVEDFTRKVAFKLDLKTWDEFLSWRTKVKTV